MAIEPGAERTGRVKRRLTTVLCADAKSYSRLMEADEAGTLETLRSYREAMNGLMARHDGRIVNTWGDAIIAEFGSVIEAVQCAIEIQTELSNRNHDLPEDQRMWFRIGINLGDVMVEADSIYGDGVNIAARLQELAEPGGILISGPVYDQVHKRLSIAFDRLGEQTVKNVSEPVTSYRVVLSGDPLHPFSTDRVEAQTGHSDGNGATAQGHFLSAFSAWFGNLPRPVAAAFAIIAFLFAINVFSGLGSIWFHWAAAPLLLVSALYLIMRGKRTGRRGKGAENKHR